MTHKDFIEHLKKNMPDVGKLKELGYSEEEIQHIKSSCLLKESESNNKYPDLKELGWLFSRYTIKDLEIGIISFIPKPIYKKDDVYLIGKVEADELVFSPANENIFVKERGGQNILWQCADSTGNFLSALAIMSEHFSKAMVDENLYDDFEYLEQVAVAASEKVGGADYISFYEMLLGI